MCDYKFTNPTTTRGLYCERNSTFWVQSTISAHNVHACTAHLARLVRLVEEKARPFQIGYRGDLVADGRYSLRFSGDAHYPANTVIPRLPHSQANGALVTVKTSTR